MNGAAQIVITWEPPYKVDVQFPENVILCTFMLRQAGKILDKHFDAPASAISLATEIPPGAAPGR